VGLRDKILRALDTGGTTWFSPNEVVELIELPIESVPLAQRHLESFGIETDCSFRTSTRLPIHLGHQGHATLFLRRADLERAAFRLDGYLIRMRGHSWFKVAPTMGAISTSSNRLLVTLRGLDADSLLHPSQLPGWTIAHIVAHLTQHADALARCAHDLRQGADTIMYPSGLDARADAIEAASGRGVDELLDGLAESCDAFAAAWIDLPDGQCRSVPDSTPFHTSTVLLRRLREIEAHGADTGLAELAPATWSTAYVGADLTSQWDTVTLRTTEAVHLIDEMGGAWRAGDHREKARNMTRRNILAWLLDRHHEPGLPTLMTWGDQSRWGR
jgi:maleylpyruvate isomerase